VTGHDAAAGARTDPAGTDPAGTDPAGTDPGPGDLLDLEVTAVAHGGHCVARADGRVVFVRHTLPGERVRARVTETRGGYLRADAVEVLRAAPQRVIPPCPHAGPPVGPGTGCGGCDFQHVTPAGQRDLKTSVVREQLVRLGGLSDAEVDALDPRVRALPGGPLGWRTRIRYAVSADGRAGLLAHRSHEVVAVDRCLIAHPRIEVVASTAGEVSVTTGSGRSHRRVAGPALLSERAGGRRWRVPAASFWQVHPAAADTFVAAVVDLLAPRPGERVLDLYAGVGIFAAALAPLVAPAPVTLVEADARAAAAAGRALADVAGLRIVPDRVERALREEGPADLVVLDPPRSGAGAAVVGELTGRIRPRSVAYVACDPAAFARDVRTFRARGWRLAELRAYDAFPMTHHMECVGLLLPA
jgi:tRNA/tmRNA/rRNA uracil-C5-methylase (TrmA/RlmC/RlmD family)